MKVSRFGMVWFILTILFGAGFMVWMHLSFQSGGCMRDLFCGVAGMSEAFGQVEADSPASLAARDAFFGHLSMMIFGAITVLQFLSFAIAFMVLDGIRKGGGRPALQLKKLENAEIFFDVPLYVGLFGTVSAFLVMTFSPQNSRLIAYSSTLIGIIFSLVLRLLLHYPMRKKLLTLNDQEEAVK